MSAPNPDLDSSNNSPIPGSHTHASGAPLVTQSPARHSPRAPRIASGSYNKDDGETFAETKRTLQARGKDYNTGSAGLQGKDWEMQQKRDEAVAILEGGEELVMWVAASRNESIPQTRTHYRNIVLGLTAQDEQNIAWREEWEIEPHLRAGGEGVQSPGKGKQREIASMRKKRVSSGQGRG